MADWTTLPDTAVGIGGLPSGTTVTALRDNPVAIAEGAVGAPRIETAALGSSFFVQGGSGTYVFAWRDSTALTSFGDTVAGSQLRPAGFTSSSGVSRQATATLFASGSNIQGSGGTDTATLSGSWRCMGQASGGGAAADDYVHTLFLRIS